MTDYGKGAVLGATVLPATSASGLLFGGGLHPVIVAGFIVINFIWLVLVISYISRYIINHRAENKKAE